MKLLLVDDEEYSREGILSVVNWKELGINEIRVAANGNEGLKSAAVFLPDIVLADIRMPQMDGLTMCHKIRELLPHCSFILISGFSDKEYLKSAIRLSAVNYLEKPFLPTELIDSLRQAIARHASYTTIAGIEQEEQLPVLENHIVTALMRRRQDGDPLWTQIAKLYPDMPADGRWLTILFSLGEAKSDTNGDLTESLLHLIREHFHSERNGSLLLGLKQENIIVLHLSVEEGADLNIRLGSLCRRVGAFLEAKRQYNISIGTPVSEIRQLYLSYDAAMAGLQQCFFLGPARTIFYKAVENPPIFSFSSEDLDHFERLLKNGNTEEIVRYIHHYGKTIQKYDHTLISTVKDFFSQLVRRLYCYSDSFILESFSMQETLAGSINRIWNAHYLSDLETYMCVKVQTLFREIRSISSDGMDNPLPYKIKNYIDSSYCSADLCLQSLSDYFNITTSYICIVFKKQYQKTVNQYINEKRIEKSIDYLENSNKKIKEISALIGYPDSNYFIKVFKKITGITPKEYRRDSQTPRYR